MRLRRRLLPICGLLCAAACAPPYVGELPPPATAGAPRPELAETALFGAAAGQPAGDLEALERGAAALQARAAALRARAAALVAAPVE